VIKTLVTVFFVFLYLVPQQIFSQPEQEALPLMLILDQLQENFDCDFTFIDDDINDIKVKKPPSNLTLKEVISYLQDNTPIDYTFVSPKNIALSAKNSILEICGVLQSIINGEPLADAIIQTKNRTTSSNEKGKFSLQLENKKQWITINFTGYYKDFGIIPGLIEPDLLQTIQALPGVLSVEETVSDINVRGGTNDQNLILWDGIKMYQSSHFFGLISAFNPYLTKNVQLSKNGSSASYGDGVSSVIAMNTSNELTKELEASTGINMISVDGYLDTPLGKKSSIQISARKSISEVLETPTYNQFFDKAFQDSEVTKTSSELSATDQEFSFYDTSIRWLYQLSNKDLIKVNGIFMNNDLVFQENALFNQTNISVANYFFMEQIITLRLSILILPTTNDCYKKMRLQKTELKQLHYSN